MEEERNYLTVLGVGNILLGDEGFGVHFVRWLDERYAFPAGVKILDGGVLSHTLLDPVCRCDHLIVVDVIKTDDLPGSVYRFTRGELETRLPPPTSAHEVTFPDVLFKAELLDELGEVTFLCVVPRDYRDLKLEMSPEMEGLFPLVAALLEKELVRLDVFWLRKDHA